MFFSAQIKEALSNLFSSRLRSFLAILGILVGTGSVVAMVSSGELAAEQALAQFKQLGTDLISASFYAQDSDNASSPSLGEITGITMKVPAIRQIAPYSMTYLATSYMGNNIDAAIIGADHSLQQVIRIDLAKGRFISYLDNNNYFCVIGTEVAKTLKEYGVLAPIGKQIQMGNSYFTIVGVAKQWQENSFFNQDINRAIIVPIGAAEKVGKNVAINNFVARLDPDAKIDDVQKEITSYLEEIAPGQQIFIRSAKQLVQSMEHQSQILTLLLGLIGSISLIVGGIGVMNIMLVSVVERRKEIGIRKAIGAKRRDIQMMFLIESVVLSLFGGILGMLLGVIISFIVAIIAKWQFHLFLLPPTIGFLVSFAIGVFFGFYPAYQAAQLDPIQTLRSD